MNTADLLGKVVTIKCNNGAELVARLMAAVEDKYYTVQSPRAVMISNDSVMLIPFVFTSDEQIVHLSANQVFSIMKTMKGAAGEYVQVITEEQMEVTEDASTS